MAAGLQKWTPLLSVERLSDLVIRVLGCNPGNMTLQGTNSYIVGKGKRRILIDTTEPDIPEYHKLLKKTLQDNGTSIQEIIVTHWHHDHCGGVPEITTNILKEPVPVSKFERLSVPDKDISPAKYTFIEDNHVFETEGATLRAMLAPGHTEESMILYLEEENAVFSGDTIIGESTSVFEDLHAYMNSLQKIKDLNPTVIYPAHGILIRNPQEVITYYMDHRNAREKQIMEALSSQEDKYMTTLDIVQLVYKDLNIKLIPMACGSAKLHLEKLVKDNKVDLVDADGEQKWRLKKH